MPQPPHKQPQPDTQEAYQQTVQKLTSYVCVLQEKTKHYAYSHLGHALYLIFLSTMILLLTVCILWDLLADPSHPFLVSLEVFITSAIVGEVIVRLFFFGFRHWTSRWLNYYDTLVAVCCVAALAIQLSLSWTFTLHLVGYSNVLRMTRDVIQIMRMVSVFQWVKDSCVDFDASHSNLSSPVQSEEEVSSVFLFQSAVCFWGYVCRSQTGLASQHLLARPHSMKKYTIWDTPSEKPRFSVDDALECTDETRLFLEDCSDSEGQFFHSHRALCDDLM